MNRSLGASVRDAEVRGRCAGMRSRGFTLLEVVVALSILGTAGLVLFAWIQQNLESARRLEDAQARAHLQIEGVSWLSLINPVAEPEGERQQADLRLRWTSILIEPLRSEFNYGENLVPRWTLGLYQVRGSLRRGEFGSSVEWEQLIVGWRPAGQGGNVALKPGEGRRP